MNINYLLLTHGISASIEANPTAPSPISNFNAEQVGSSIQLSWTNPTDEGFLGVRIQRKIGSYPTSATDGITVFDGFSTTHLDSNITVNSTYYYRAFAYGRMNMINDHISQQTNIAFNTAKIYTVIIDTSNSNPSASVSYADDAIGMVAGASNWDSVFPFNEIKPVMLKNGVVNYYLNPNNFAQKLDGTNADITSGADGDVMIQFPKFYIYIRKNGNLIYVSLSDQKVNDNYKCYAHTKGSIEKDYLYIASYVGNITNSKLNSLSGFFASTETPPNQARTSAQNNGQGYQLFSYYQHLMIQVLYLIKYKNLNSQAAVGNGVVDNDWYVISGTLNSAGMDAGNKTGLSTAVKLFGLENLWGSNYVFIDGFAVDTTFNVYTTNTNFNDARTGYTNHGIASFTYSIDSTTYFTDVVGSTELGFIPIEINNGSSSTYFSDGCFFGLNAIGLGSSGVWELSGCGIFGVGTVMADDAPLLAITSYRLAFL